MIVNQLYLAVLPLVHLNNGLTEQVLTLLPDKNFATNFDETEVDNYLAFFRARANTVLSGGILGYEFVKERIMNGRVIVKVIQRVA